MISSTFHSSIQSPVYGDDNIRQGRPPSPASERWCRAWRRIAGGLGAWLVLSSALFAQNPNDGFSVPLVGEGTGATEIGTIALLPDGMLLAGGLFSKVHNTSTANLVRLRPDG